MLLVGRDGVKRREDEDEVLLKNLTLHELHGGWNAVTAGFLDLLCDFVDETEELVHFSDVLLLHRRGHLDTAHSLGELLADGVSDCIKHDCFVLVECVLDQLQHILLVLGEVIGYIDDAGVKATRLLGIEIWSVSTVGRWGLLRDGWIQRSDLSGSCTVHCWGVWVCWDKGRISGPGWLVKTWGEDGSELRRRESGGLRM